MASALSFSNNVSTSSPLLAVRPAAAGDQTGPAPTMATLATALENISLGELRKLARAKGLHGDTRNELVKLLLSEGSPANGSTSTSNGAAMAAPTLPYDQRALQTMPLAQLRAVARSRGVQGNTRDQILQSLLLLPTKTSPSSAVAQPARSPAAPVSTPAVAAPVSPAAAAAVTTAWFTRQQLLSKTLPSVRAIARSKGIANANALGKEQLILALTNPGTILSEASRPLPGASPTVQAAVAGTTSVEDLTAMSLGQLRTLGRERGIRADTKSELVKLLASIPTPVRDAAPSATTVQEPQVLPSFESASPLPPFQSAIPEGGTTALEPIRLASEVSALKQAMEDIEARDEALAAERDSLLEQANFLRNVLIGGIGLAALPLLLPFQLPTTTVSLTSTPIVAPTEPTAPAPPPAPIVEELSPEEYCKTLPVALLSPQIAKFCDALIEPGF